jgi:hypothetical protein
MQLVGYPAQIQIGFVSTYCQQMQLSEQQQTIVPIHAHLLFKGLIKQPKLNRMRNFVSYHK